MNDGKKKKKEQVQVFYVKYQKDEKSGLIIHDPIPALTPINHNQEEGEEDDEERISIVTPLPPQKSTTLSAIIRPESMQYESNSGVHVTFGSPHNHNSKADTQVHDEVKVESAIRPVIQLPLNRVGPISAPKDKRAPQTQGRVVNGSPVNFNQVSQNVSPQRPHIEFNPQNNYVAPPNQGHLSHQLSLPSQEPSKPFHPNSQNQQHHHQHFQSPQQPVPIPVHHQQPSQFSQQLAHQQFNQPPQRLQTPQQQQQSFF